VILSVFLRSLITALRVMGTRTIEAARIITCSPVSLSIHSHGPCLYQAEHYA
jgi:hypothetical protein